MIKPVIQVENLAKAYQLGQFGTGTLSRDFQRFWTTRILGKEDPYLKIEEKTSSHSKNNNDLFWSLRDINFDVFQGDAVGIIGKNGAGKSTLLKLLSRVTSPTKGQIKVKGRIASLLEVGTGFHPELTGRENIFLNGAILGMRKSEINKKLDEIIYFSGVERYIDTPVKRYSSGMYVRLAFAVAAHLESEILIVDEVLAVGDAEFQKKCLGKMSDISKGEGRTVLFVSHNMAAVKALCNRGIVIEKGTLKQSLPINDAINLYLEESSYLQQITNYNFENVNLTTFEILSNGKSCSTIQAFEPLCFNIEYEYLNTIPLETHLELFIKNKSGIIITTLSTWLSAKTIIPKNGKLKIKCYLNSGFSLLEGSYLVDIRIVDVINQTYENILTFDIINSLESGYIREVQSQYFGTVYTPNMWEILNI